MNKVPSLFLIILCHIFFSPSFFKLNAQEELSLLEDSEVTISMDFQDADLKDILKIFSIQSGLNFIASETVKDRKITLYLDKVPIKEAMDKLFKANNLAYEVYPDSNIYIIKDLGKPKVETVTKIFPFKYATVSSSSLKSDMAALIHIQATGITGGAGGGMAGGGMAGGAAKGKWKGEDNSGITEIIKKMLSENGWLIEDYRTNSLIITDIPDSITKIAQVIESLDVPIPQVMLEVEMLDVSKNAVDRLGVNWPQAPLRLTMPGSRETRFPFAKRLATSGQGRSIDPEKGVFGGGWDFGAWGASNFGPNILTVVGATVSLDFLRSQSDTKFLARPRLLTLNNETAEIKITTDEVIGERVSYDDQGNVSSRTAERQQTGVSLRVTPQVNMELGEVTMFIYPQVKEATTSVFIGAGGATFKDPEERGTKSLVKVKDGETVVLGGLIRNEFQQTYTKFPILSDIPILGALFRHKNKEKDRERELLVFITPHIIKEKETRVARAKKSGLPEREQSAASGYDRQAAINAGLNSFEKLSKPR